ncbi:polysaccharide deacetylase family protein [Desulfuromonas thiophila]|uniref:Peptidoglycan/xylan/chitin deacetylase, PgdA/CDA1 family n=2 Tax=Desulfuromonas thiophila TaxID=57664 RepID=A0A1G7BZB1_9BACT|nr:polysaccharide deacetylase family protein [Desulfuromonas thiophila]SDE32402.1 Peptidoglycan/xylan/chitin deacetylase, PgdA/CDA1 family [Desulfuromonas thiophila]
MGNGLWAALLLLLLLVAPVVAADPGGMDADYTRLRQRLVARFDGERPRLWAEQVPGVKTRIAANEPVIALTLDACGSPTGMGADTELIAFLERQRVPATLFINARWIEPNRALFERLAANPLFEIANHGLAHKPASVSGRSIYGLAGTANVAELVDEIELAARRLQQLTGRRPAFYRSGTAYYDEVAVQLAQALGQQVAGFSILGDRGATYSSAQVRDALLASQAGDIIIAHMNHPEAGTGQGIMAAVPLLRQRGLRFVRLSDYPLQ